tara:strand:- start:823 stop:1524 length:702 start_codon:yes stop_codon:yes gene_type:complete
MFSIIIPAYNEEKRIRQTLINYINFFKDKNVEIFVVLNGCRDNTLAIVKEFSRKHPQIKYQNYPEKLGKGGAILKGFQLVNGSLIAYTDSDGSTKPEDLFDLTRKIQDYDGVIGSRWLKNSVITKKQDPLRIFLGRGYNLLVRLILNLPFKDTQCASKVFKKEAILSIINEVEVTNFSFDAALLYKLNKKGFKIKEEPIIWENKGGSTVNLTKDVPKMLTAIIKVRLKDLFKL